jgi:hypothetical protein
MFIKVTGKKFDPAAGMSRDTMIKYLQMIVSSKVLELSDDALGDVYFYIVNKIEEEKKK